MIEQQTTELAVHRLLTQRLSTVDADQDETWSQGIEELCAELLHLDADVSATLAAVVRACAVIQEFLLEAFVPLPADRRPVIEMAEWLLENLHNEECATQPTHPVPVAHECPEVMGSDLDAHGKALSAEGDLGGSSSLSAELTALIPGLTLLEADTGTLLAIRTASDGRVEVTAHAADGIPGLRAEVDLQDAVAYWHPGLRGARPLPADWVGSGVTSLVQSAPVGALYAHSGEVLLGWAAGEAIAELSIRVGVSEERKSFVIEIRPVRPLELDLVVVLDGTRSPLAATIRGLAQWLSDRCSGDVLVPPPVAGLPVYSTWYTFTQDIDAHLVRADAELAAEMGFGSVFIDDGWQRLARGRGYQGCDDWLPDTAKFPDLRDTVDTIHRLGTGIALWVAPLLLGRDSAVFPDLARFAPEWVPELNCHVLDPRFAEVREHVATTCLRLVEDYDADLLKIDFLDQAMVYKDSIAAGDTGDVGEAMAAMLSDVRRRLADSGHRNIGFEFRQPYVSPAAARFAEILRANDCPADSVMNRLATVDARLIAVGQAVHSDPMMWGAAGGAEAVAQQLYSGWFAVPQISMRLADLSETQSAAVRGLLGLWREHADVTLAGTLDVVGAERGFDLVRTVRADLGRSVIARYASVVIDLVDDNSISETTIINATADDRIVVRTTRPIHGGAIRAASAAITATVSAREAGGLIEIAVPAFGSVTLRS